MDPVSQGLAGAVLPGSVSKKKEIRLALIVGFLSGLLADIDVLIRSSQDPFLFLEYHRQFTHSIIFIPIGGLAASLILWIFVRKRLSFGKLYLYATLGYATHAFIDASTSYGTSLFWPFSDVRVSWGVISIVDPIFTLTLLALFIIAFVKRSVNTVRVSLAFAVFYLLLGYYQKERAHDFIMNVAALRGHTVERIVVRPSIGNLLVWRTVYESDGYYYADAVRAGISGLPGLYEGNRLKAFYPDDGYPGVRKDSIQHSDILRFNRFSNGFLAIHPDYPRVIGDARYSLLPNGVLPLWGIKVDSGKQNSHAEMYDFDSSVSKEKWQTFVNMLLGKPLN